MPSSLVLIGVLLLGGSPGVQSDCKQVAPVPLDGKWARSPQQTQAVVLIHGFYYHLTDKSVAKPGYRPWQGADAPLVKELAKNADVYSFAYGQNATIDAIAKDSKLGDDIAQLRKLGYKDIVLIGHSAGGLIARHFVEDNPDSGVTKVLQVCAPNGGSPLAGSAGLPKSQKIFVECLTEECRKQCMKDREKKLVPAKVQFVCVIARSEAGSKTDGVVPCVNQWTADLQTQGIPAICVVCGHREAVRDAKIAETLASVLRDKNERWSAERVEKARKDILGK
jgi:hypothetical protein